MMCRPAAALVCALLFTPGLRGQSALPRVEDAEWGPVRTSARQLLEALRGTADALPAHVRRRLATLLEEKKEPAAALKELQGLLDPLCLVGVHINPESRVKAARGPAPAELVRGRPKVVLVKVHNEAGVTHALAVGGDQVRTPGRGGPERWLEAVVLAGKPPAKGLSGARLEYVPLRLRAREAGKREATLAFDAGQGTQDLGFRAEVPILFRVRPAGR